MRGKKPAMADGQELTVNKLVRAAALAKKPKIWDKLVNRSKLTGVSRQFLGSGSRYDPFLF